MRYAISLLVAAAFMAPLTGSAQVFKCKNAQGQAIYSDKACSTTQSGGLLERRRTFEEKMQEREQAYAAQVAKEERRALEAAREDAAAERRAMGVAMQPQTPRHKGYAERLAERNAGVRSNLTGAPPGGRGLTRAQREQALSQADTPQARSELMREATTVMNGAQGLTAAQMDAARRLAAAKPGQPLPPSALPPEQYDAAPRPADIAQPPGAPAQVVNCDTAGCWDTNGNRLNNAGGGNFHRSDGAFCTRAGPNAICN